ncbi:glutathione-disulfide reductase [Acidithiobacillus sp. AMEEHan]|uniref:glutathione-disulfide reductase n=1 Tax=Acidithiobacillus sp. AMEEHan TaxID=2994951 RepID=UPI0027E3C4A9|nr:glutathione-disulfide reductase [Acidithiobacillus sp. AMEEHan]
MPKKLFWNAAHLGGSHELAQGYGFAATPWDFSWNRFKSRRDTYVQRLNGRYAEGLQNNRVTLFRGHGRLRGKDQVSVDDEYLLTAPKILLATGGAPIWPEIPGAELGIDSDGFFALGEQPQRVAVVGAGYIAVELAGVLRALGSDVSLVMRRNHFLHGFEPMLREHLMETMQAQGINLLAQRQVRQLRREEGGLCLDFAQGDCLGGLDAVLWAIGRRPLTRDLGLEEAGLTAASDGYLEVDPYQNTAVEGIYAVGDITRAPALTPVAIAAGRRLADRLFGGQSERHLDTNLTPTVIFSHPPIATVGMSEIEARERYGDDQVKCYQTRFVPLLRAFQNDPERTAMKLVTVGHEERIVGLHAIGDGVEEMLQGFAVAIRMGARKRDFDDTIAIHPTSSEEFVTLR